MEIDHDTGEPTRPTFGPIETAILATGSAITFFGMVFGAWYIFVTTVLTLIYGTPIQWWPS